MFYITTYSRTITHRKGPKKGQTVTYHTHYSTKSLTPMHAAIRDRYKGSKTYEGVKLVYIHLFPGLPLDAPIVSGGKLIAQS